MMAAALVDRATARPFPWWQNWQRRTVAIVACGPSAKNAGVENLRGRVPVIAIKEAAINLCPWADVVYGCDAAWWIHRRGLPGFRGVKIAWAREVATMFPDVNLIAIARKAHPKPIDDLYSDNILTANPGVIGGGRNSGFQALNIAVQFGAARIMLIGFDANATGGEHYYGRNNWYRANNPTEANFEKWRTSFLIASADLRRLNVEAVNCSVGSSIAGFHRVTIEQALSKWQA